VTAIAMGATSLQAAEIAWQDKFWNPQAMDGDFVVPLPCGGAMTFRRVDTTLPGNWLTDFRVQLGSASSDLPYSDYTRFEFIAGSLADGDDPASRHYFIGKYEVTQDQYAAVMDDSCPTPGMAGRLPKVATSWYDAVEFTKRLTTWLNKEADGALPQEDGQRSFIRLPTETEWEFAARGGGVVTDESEFRRSVFPMEDDNMSRYVWFQGPQSCAGDLQLTGMLEPNPLGLFDILGNAEEIVLEPYRANRSGRLHGQVGGFVVKGGSCLTDQRAISTAARTEFSYFNDRTGEPLAPELAGFRVIIAGPVLVSHQRVAAFEGDWERAISVSDDQSIPEILENLIEEEVSSPVVAERLQQVSALARSQDSERADTERRAVRTSIQSGAFIIQQYLDDWHEVTGIQRSIEIIEETSDDTDANAGLLEAYLRKIDELDDNLRLTKSVYASILKYTADNYSAQLLDDQLTIVIDRFRQMGQGEIATQAEYLVTYAEVFTDHVRRWQEEGGLDSEVLIQELNDL
jgi:formylglycine-generating enzyme required for sulfatase activity